MILFMRNKMGIQAQPGKKSVEDFLGGNGGGRQEFGVDINVVIEKTGLKTVTLL